MVNDYGFSIHFKLIHHNGIICRRLVHNGGAIKKASN